MKKLLKFGGAIALGLLSIPCFAQDHTLVMDGLANPRGLAFGPEGALYVAEAGTGGPGPCIQTGPQYFCHGPTGAVIRFWRGVKETGRFGSPGFLKRVELSGCTGQPDTCERTVIRSGLRRPT